MEWKLTEQGPRAVIEVWRENDGQGLYKGWLVGQSGRCLLGTLAPEDGRLFLRRTLSIDSLRRQGVWPVCRVEEEQVCSFDQPELNWSDEVLRQCACRLPPHTLRREGDGVVLSFPFDPYKPFPLTPVFCFACVERGRLLFFFRRDGTAYIVPVQGNDRKEAKEQRREHHGESDHQGTGRAGGSAGL